MQSIAMLVAVALGAFFAQQPVINSAVARSLGSSLHASVLSVFITLCCMLALLPFFSGTFKPVLQFSLPWWSVLGGLIGVSIVLGGAVLAPILGAALLFVCLVAGQLIGAAIADHIGAFGMPVRELSSTRVIGLLLVLIGAILVHRGA